MLDNNSPLLYGLEQRIPPVPATFSALQHVLASLVGIITPPLIIGSALGLNAWLPYLISMSLLASGIGTLLQSNRKWGIGAGMICLQGTSFAFPAVIISGGLIVKSRGGSPEDIMGMIFGVNCVAALVPVLFSRCISSLKRVFTPLVTGTVITLIGISLLKVSMTDWAGGLHVDNFGKPINLMIGGTTLFVTVFFARLSNRWLRLSAIVAGIGAGTLLAWASGQWTLKPVSITAWFSTPHFFRFGFHFDWSIFLPVAFVSLIGLLEAVGDITANCMFSRQPIDDEAFHQRLKRGILADGVSCLVAACLSSFPNSTFAQNNGVIQMTGVASRHVGRYIAGLLILLGLFPAVGGILEQIPAPVLGGATLVIFGSIVAAGIRIMTQSVLGHREMLIVALSFGIGLGIESVPGFLSSFPPLIGNLFGSAVTSGGAVAIILNFLLPDERRLPVSAEVARDREPVH